MTYEVKTRVFEGPLDLLLQLITSHQLEITELSLVDLVTEYLRYLDVMRDMDIEVTSEFLLIAATLIQIKARRLLPDDREIDLDEELALAEERDRLLARLLACLTFKDVAAVFHHRLDSSLRFVPRMAGLDPEIVPKQPDLHLDLSPAELAVIAERAFAAGSTEPDLDHLAFDLPSVDDAIGDVRRRMAAALDTSFEHLIDRCERPIEVVAYFLAVLELVRWGAITISQEAADHPIRVMNRDDALTEELDRMTLRSEWRAAP
jgi:segregation and condensation protein A